MGKLEYIIYRQKLLLEKQMAELEAEEEAARVAKMEAEAREDEEIAARKQKEAERLRQKRVQKEEK